MCLHPLLLFSFDLISPPHHHSFHRAPAPFYALYQVRICSPLMYARMLFCVQRVLRRKADVTCLSPQRARGMYKGNLAESFSVLVLMKTWVCCPVQLIIKMHTARQGQLQREGSQQGGGAKHVSVLGGNSSGHFCFCSEDYCLL